MATLNGTIYTTAGLTLRLAIRAMNGTTVVNFTDGSSTQTNADTNTTITEVVSGTYNFTTTLFPVDTLPVILLIENNADGTDLETVTVDGLDLLQPALSVPSVTDDNRLSIDYATDVTIDVPAVGTQVIGAQEIWFTVKESELDTDANALFKISLDNGLEIINKAAAGTPANGTLVTDGQLIPSVRVTLAAVEMAKLLSFADQRHDWNLKVINSSGSVLSLKSGKIDFVAIATHDVS